MKHVFIQTAMAATFFRCGTEFTKAGRVFDLSDFDEKQIERIRHEKNLHAREATPEEIAAFEADHVEPVLNDDLQKQISEIVQLLAPADFGKDGKPKITSVRDALPDQVDPKLVTKTGLHGVFSDLIDKGFTAPTAE